MPFLCFFKYITSLYRSVKIPLHSPSFAFAIFSPLYSSSSSHSTIHCVISELLVNECGFCPSQLTKFFKRRPSLLQTRTDHTAREAIHLLRDSGFTENQLHKTIVRNPSILTYKVDGQLKLKIEFMKTLGFTAQDLANIICKQPRLLSISLENNLRPKISHLKNLFGLNINLCKVLTAAPELLVTHMEKQVKPKVEYVENNMGISQGSTLFLYALRQVLSNGIENVVKKMKRMQSLGFSEEEVHQIVKRQPQVLGLSPRNMQEKIDFLIHTAGLTPGTLVSDPVLLTLSLEKRFKPRYEVFKSLSSKPHFKVPPSMVSFLKLSEKKFLQKFGKSNTQDKSTDHTST